ncbi:MAG: hypothetical protein M1821_000134 [Bathelium mastoideum]|nr:MAG: hypothetical protein M1821_000134 [Bathelium mastoideum]KAI9687834.1 MAG: hypothetical protein M1822_001914 [Bathelium mastoideum]
MGSLFTSFCSLELRTAPKVPWKRPLRSNGWVCPQCRTRQTSKQRYQHAEAQGRDRRGAEDNADLPENIKLPAFRARPLENFPSPPVNEKTPDPSGNEPDSEVSYEENLTGAVEAMSRDREARRKEVQESLIRRDSYRLLVALRAVDGDREIFASLPSTTITEILKLLDPDHFITEYKEAYGRLSNSTVFKMGRVPLEYLLEDYLLSITDIVKSVGLSGKELRLSDYRALLRCARACCRGDLADRLWAEMSRAKVIPDTACYNNYLGAKCWSGAHLAETRLSYRVTPFTLMARARAKLGEQFANYRVREGGIKAIVMAIFDDMQAHQISANEETFRHVMTALSREGDMDGVRVVLRRIFDLDVDAIMRDADPPNMSEVPRISKASPFYPTEQFLFTLAHVFGATNDVPTALRLVDHVSQLYAIPVSGNTWRELLTWTCVLAERQKEGRRLSLLRESLGGLPGSSVGSLFKTMTSPPYNIAPSIEMMKMLVSNARYQGDWNLIRVYLQRADQLELASQARLEHAYAGHRAATRAHAEGYEARERLHRARAHVEAAATVNARHRRTLRSFVHMLLGKPTVAHVPAGEEGSSLQWQRVDVPDILWEHRRWAPSFVRYRTRGGVVELRFRTPEEAEMLAAREAARANHFALEASATTTGRLVEGLADELGLDGKWVRQRDRLEEGEADPQMARYEPTWRAVS